MGRARRGGRSVTGMDIGEVARMIQADCVTDAGALDSTPFTPRGVGEALGTTLAMVAALAKAIEHLNEKVEALA